ncbi:MAG TPA: hypothetical protein VF459_00580 [Caulobacteraceae bacterium]
MFRFRLIALAAGLLVLPKVAAAFPDTYAGRLEALTQVQRLQTQLLSRDSASETLSLWCAEHHWADPAQIRAVRDTATVKPPSPQVRDLLGAGARTPIRYRRVKLMCGERVLSEADNWYLPGKLTAEMNRLLDQTDTPFGVAVKALNFKRQGLDSRILLHPFEETGESGPSAAAPPPGAEAPPLSLPHAVIQNSAVLTAADGTAFSVVVETYTGAALDQPSPPSR